MRRLADAAHGLLPAVAIAGAAVSIGLVLWAGQASGTLGYDYSCCYDLAARRALAGGPIYDLSFHGLGPGGLFDYPIPFLGLVLPFAALLSPQSATIAWIGLLLLAMCAGIAALPVRREVRWLTLLLAGVSWPVVYSLKLGQVGALLFLILTLAWRNLARDGRLGVLIGLGTLTKLQPGLLFVWLALRLRVPAIVAGGITILVLVIAATIAAGLGQWADYVTLLRQVSDPIATPQSLAPAAIAYRLGASVGVATAIQVGTDVGALLILLRVSLRGPADVSFLAAVVVSQLITPVLWDHYAFLLLLPVAWFLERGIYAAALIPLLLAWPLQPVTPGFLYPLLFGITLLALLAVAERGPARAAAPAGAT